MGDHVPLSFASAGGASSGLAEGGVGERPRDGPGSPCRFDRMLDMRGGGAAGGNMQTSHVELSHLFLRSKLDEEQGTRGAGQGFGALWDSALRSGGNAWRLML